MNSIGADFMALKVTDLMIMYSECVVFNCNFDHLLITHIISEYAAGSKVVIK